MMCDYVENESFINYLNAKKTTTYVVNRSAETLTHLVTHSFLSVFMNLHEYSNQLNLIHKTLHR